MHSENYVIAAVACIRGLALWGSYWVWLAVADARSLVLRGAYFSLPIAA
jgi:hypothetical protein